MEYFETSVLDLVESLELLDDEFAVHDEMNFIGTEISCCFEAENGAHVFCLIVGR